MTKSDDKRRNKRRAVLWSGDLQYGEHEFRCHIWDVSLGGTKVKVGVPLAIGTPVQISLGRFGKFKGNVAWQKDDTLGLQFNEAPELIRSIFGDSIIKLGLDGTTAPKPASKKSK